MTTEIDRETASLSPAQYNEIYRKAQKKGLLTGPNHATFPSMEYIRDGKVVGRYNSQTDSYEALP